MHVEINYSNFEVFYRNTFSPSQSYNFIEVTEDESRIDPKFTIDGIQHILEISVQQLNKYSYSTKEECVKEAIAGRHTLFSMKKWYLYKHNGMYGKYQIGTQTFLPFDESPKMSCENKVYMYYYKKMSL